MPGCWPPRSWRSVMRVISAAGGESGQQSRQDEKNGDGGVRGGSDRAVRQQGQARRGDRGGCGRRERQIVGRLRPEGEVHEPRVGKTDGEFNAPWKLTVAGKAKALPGPLSFAPAKGSNLTLDGKGGDDQLAGGADVGAVGAERLAERRGDDVDPAHDAAVLVGAAAGLADEAGRILRQRGIEVDFTALTWDDPAVYELLQRGDTVGVFQLESEGMRRTLAGVRPSAFGDIIALVALYRPGPMQYIPVYARRKAGQSPSAATFAASMSKAMTSRSA